MNAWDNLRGNDLVDFAVHTKLENTHPDFFVHFAQHATQDEFKNLLMRHPQALKYSIRMHPYFPRESQECILLALAPTNPNIGNACFEVVSAIAAHDLPRPFLQYISYEHMTVEQLDKLFHRLLRAKLTHVVRANAQCFSPAFAIKTYEKVLHAASMGWDLIEHWTPDEQKDEQKVEYFVACCQGGLLNRICNLPVSNAVARQGFMAATLSKPSNLDTVLQYLWDTHPTIPWHHERFILERIGDVSHAMSKQLIAHLQIHDPNGLKVGAHTVAVNAAGTDWETVKLFLPHVEEKKRIDVAASAVYIQNPDMLRKILQLPYITFQAHDLLAYMRAEHHPWIEGFISAEQKGVLNTHVSQGTKDSAKRKM